MWFSKFFAHSTRRMLDNAGKDCRQTRGICKRIFRQERSRGHEKIIALRSERCKAYKNALARCPKTPWERLCCKKLFAKPLPQVEVKCIGDIYHETYNAVKLEGKDVLQQIENEIKLIRDSLSSLPIEDHHLKAIHGQLTHNVMSNMRELLSMSPRCGSVVRKEMLLLNDEAWRAIYALKHDSVPGIRQVNIILDRIQEETCSCVEQATLIVKSCKSCKKHDILSACIKKNSDHARTALKSIQKNAMEKLGDAKRYRDRIVRYHMKETDEVNSKYRKKMSDFNEYLERCIEDVKKKKKKKK